MAAINLSTPGVAVTENFDSLANTGTSSVLPNGWAISETGSTANLTYTASTGSLNSGDTYSFGAAGSTDRALGTLQSGSLISTFGANFSNGTGGAITSLLVSYTGEEWRFGTPGRADRLDFQYSLNATSLTAGTWTDVDALDFNTPDVTGSVGARDGNSAAERTAISSTISGLNIGAGAQFWIRWTDFNAASSDDGLAVDNFSVTPGGSGGSTTSVSINSVSLPEGDTGTTTATFTVTRSDNTGAFTLNYATADGTATAGSDYAAISGSLTFTAGGALTQTISVAINGDTITEPDETFSLTLSNLVSTTGAANISQAVGTGTIQNDDVTLAPIYSIQGAAHTSPFAGQSVTTSGVVTALTSNGFFLQDATGDGNVATSDAILVFTSTAPSVAIGNSVRVAGTVTEFFPSSSSSAELSVTQITTPTVTFLGTAALPDAVLIGAPDASNPAIRTPPTVSLGDNVSTGTFDPATQGSDFYESLEGMRVTLLNTRAVSPYATSGTFEVTPTIPNDPSNNAHGGLTISDTTPNQPDPAQKVFDFNPERLQLFGGAGTSLPTNVKVGDQLGAVTGVLSYFTQYELLPTAPVTVTSGGLQKETSTIAANLDRVTAVGFNVQNLSPVGTPNGGSANTPQSKFDALAGVILSSLGTPSIIALEEVQDNNGTGGGGGVSAHLTLQTLIAAIAAQGGPTYTAIDAPPVDGTEGGAPGGNIRNAYLYLADQVTPTATNNLVLRNDGIYDFPTAQRIGTGNPDFSSTRKSVPIEWSPNGFSAAQGGSFYTVANHFSSKGGSDPLYSIDLGQPLYNENLDRGATKREGQAAALNAFVDGVLADGISTNDRVIALGDFNEYQFFPAIQVATGELVRVTAGSGATPSTFQTGPAVLTDLITTLPVAERYTYNFDGNSQALDHILLTNGQVATAQYDVVHLNSEFPDQLSDHDPSIVSLLLPRSAAIATSGSDTLDQAAYTAVFGAVRGSLAGDDTIDGGGGDDVIEAGAGNDVLIGGAGADTLTGGSGADVFLYNALTDSPSSAGDNISDFQTGQDIIDVSAADAGYVAISYDGTRSNVAFGTPTGAGFPDGITVDGFISRADLRIGASTQVGLFGSAGADTLTGGSEIDLILGGGGDDVITGGVGADSLSGGAGADVFRYLSLTDSPSGAGDNISDFQTGLDIIDVSAADAGYVAISYDGTRSNVAFGTPTGAGFPDGITVDGFISRADLRIGASTQVGLFGSAGADILTGGSEIDLILGGAGNDVITGGGGADSLSGGAGADVFRYDSLMDSAVGASDYIADFESGIDKIDLSRTDGGYAKVNYDGIFSYVSFGAPSSTGFPDAIVVLGQIVSTDLILSQGAIFQFGG